MKSVRKFSFVLSVSALFLFVPGAEAAVLRVPQDMRVVICVNMRKAAVVSTGITSTTERMMM